MWLGTLQKRLDDLEKAMELEQAAMQGTLGLLETLRTAVSKSDSEIKRLEGLLSSSSSSVLKKSVEDLELWKASLMAELKTTTAAGRPRKTALWGRLKGRT